MVLAGSSSPEFTKWKHDVETVLRREFGEKSAQRYDFRNVDYHSGFFSGNSSFEEAFADGLRHADALLQSISEEVKQYWDDDMADKSGSADDDKVVSMDVFIVHGHDNEAKQTVARFVEKLQLHPVILHEQPNRGRTIIEKFEEYATPAFAVVLLTPDDTCVDPESKGSPTLRPRQNVILELGLFLGKLGRDKVCCLVKGKPKLPSDYDGVAYVPLDGQGSWKMSLVKEMKAAGLSVDANLAL